MRFKYAVCRLHQSAHEYLTYMHAEAAADGIALSGAAHASCVLCSRRQRIRAMPGREGYALLRGGEAGMTPAELRALPIVIHEARASSRRPGGALLRGLTLDTQSPGSCDTMKLLQLTAVRSWCKLLRSSRAGMTSATAAAGSAHGGSRGHGILVALRWCSAAWPHISFRDAQLS